MTLLEEFDNILEDGTRSSRNLLSSKYRTDESDSNFRNRKISLLSSKRIESRRKTLISSKNIDRKKLRAIALISKNKRVN